MSLEQLSKTVDFVQATTPSNANDGETYLDTSQSPPQLKVFDSNAGTFVQPRSIQNLDAPVSGAGATQTDIETAVDNSTTASTVNSNLDTQISSRSSHSDPDPNGYIDQAISNVGGIDFSSKSTHSTYTHVTGGVAQSVSGSGYLLDVIQGVAANSGAVDLDIDGFHFFETDATDKNGHVVTGPLRFNSSFTVEETRNPNDADFLIIWVED